MSSESSSATADREELLWKAWSAGELSWLLNKDQRVVHDQYRAWELLDPTTQEGDFPRCFVLDIGRRYGKTTLRLLTRVEDAIRNPGRLYRIASAYQKGVDEIVGDVSRFVFETCPEELRPRYLQSRQRYVFRNGSEIRLVGLDMHPDGLRGRASDGDDLSEAAFIKGLAYTVKSVLYPQYQGRPWARICMESSAPVESDAEYDKVFVDDARRRGAYAYRTIDDNPLLSDEEREEFIRAAGGRGSPTAQREYFNERVRDPVGSVVPEFSRSKHVSRSEVPAYARCYVSADPGVRDKFALVFGYADVARGKLVIQRSWAQRNASLADVAEVVLQTERELWGVEHHGSERALLALGTSATAPHSSRLSFWDGERVRGNPARRVSDTDARTLVELRAAHGIEFGAADKRHARHAADAGSARRLEQPKLYVLRTWLANGKIEIWPDSGPLEEQLERGRWNSTRTDFERSDAIGHLDALMALVYMLPAVDLSTIAEPPAWAGLDPREHYIPDTLRRERADVAELNKAFGVGGTQRRRFDPRRAT
jgi:hypothetical protein